MLLCFVKILLLFEPAHSNNKSRSTPVRISRILCHFPTPKIRISRSSTFQTACALFAKHPGGIPPMRTPGETRRRRASNRRTVPCSPHAPRERFFHKAVTHSPASQPHTFPAVPRRP